MGWIGGHIGGVGKDSHPFINDGHSNLYVVWGQRGVYLPGEQERGVGFKLQGGMAFKGSFWASQRLHEQFERLVIDWECDFRCGIEDREGGQFRLEWREALRGAASVPRPR